MKLNIKPYDMLFFGTGRPFTMEDESWTKGIFPPNPSTVYGYLRSTYFENNMSDLSKANTNDDPTKHFVIETFNLSLLEKEKKKQIQLFPIPFGHILNENKKIEELELKENEVISNNPFTYYLYATTDGKAETLDNTYYITKKELENYLNGKPIKSVCKITKYLVEEQRIGIATNNKTGKTEEGKLYRIAFNHLNTVDLINNTETVLSFNVKVTAKDLTSAKLRTLGGEGKKAFLQETEFDEVSTVTKQNINALLYFTTPAILETSFFNDFGTIQCIANDKPQYIGGWDMAKKQPKPMQKAYPAGTVFFVQFTDEGKIKEFQTQFNNKIGELTKEGFGQFFLGNQPTNKNN